MVTVASVHLPSGIHIASPLSSLQAFCTEEYAYYDGIPSRENNSIEPVDVLATVSMNSFVNNAEAVRRVHRGMAEHCNAHLATIPVDADLAFSDATLLASVRNLLAAALDTRGVLIPVATKVLHRKRRALVPMLDSVLIEHYRPGYVQKMQDKGTLGNLKHAYKRADIADRAMDVMALFRQDLLAAQDELAALRLYLAADGFDLTQVRILELLVWMHCEPNQYYG